MITIGKCSFKSLYAAKLKTYINCVIKGIFRNQHHSTNAENNKCRSPVSKTQISFVSLNEANLTPAVTICLIAYLFTCSFAVLTIYSLSQYMMKSTPPGSQQLWKKLNFDLNHQVFWPLVYKKKKSPTWKYYPNTDSADGALLLAFEHSTFVPIPASMTSSLWI